MRDVEWDPAKDAANLAKHGIGFADAASVFDDPNRHEIGSSRPKHGEERRKTIGRDRGGRGLHRPARPATHHPRPEPTGKQG